jgi:hypothetical protein
MFWGACFQCEQILAGGLRALGAVAKLADVIKLFTTPFPQGLNKCGLKLHPKQGLVGYTLITHLALRDRHEYRRWQRSQDGKAFPAEPEVYRFDEALAGAK